LRAEVRGQFTCHFPLSGGLYQFAKSVPFLGATGATSTYKCLSQTSNDHSPVIPSFSLTVRPPPFKQFSDSRKLQTLYHIRLSHYPRIFLKGTRPTQPTTHSPVRGPASPCFLGCWLLGCSPQRTKRSTSPRRDSKVLAKYQYLSSADANKGSALGNSRIITKKTTDHRRHANFLPSFCFAQSSAWLTPPRRLPHKLNTLLRWRIRSWGDRIRNHAADLRSLCDARRQPQTRILNPSHCTFLSS